MKSSTKYVSDSAVISLDDAIGYDLYPCGERGKVPVIVIILMFLFFFPLGILLCIVNVCSKHPVYLFTVYKKDHQICKRVVGSFKHTQTLEKMRRLDIPQVKGY